MAKEITGIIKLQIRGGAANPAPPVRPALGAKGVNIMEFCKQFNARTQDSPGKVVPVVITVFADKSFEFIIKTAPAASQLLEAAKKKREAKKNKERAKKAKEKWSGRNRLKIGEILFSQHLASFDQISKSPPHSFNHFSFKNSNTFNLLSRLVILCLLKSA